MPGTLAMRPGTLGHSRVLSCNLGQPSGTLVISGDLGSSRASRASSRTSERSSDSTHEEMCAERVAALRASVVSSSSCLISGDLGLRGQPRYVPSRVLVGVPRVRVPHLGGSVREARQPRAACGAEDLNLLTATQGVESAEILAAPPARCGRERRSPTGDPTAANPASRSWTTPRS